MQFYQSVIHNVSAHAINVSGSYLYMKLPFLIENVDECASLPCINAVRIDVVNSFSCQCQDGYGGLRCNGGYSLALFYKPCMCFNNAYTYYSITSK